jgi:biotin transport system substrate-specific component
MDKRTLVLEATAPLERRVPGMMEVSRAAASVLLFAGLTALAGQIRVPLPFTPVPLTLQLLPVLLAGALLGPARGAMSQLVFLGAGVLGLPVFSAAAAGLAHVTGPTGGYLIGFAAAALLVGILLHSRPSPAFPRLLLVMCAGAVTVHLLGVLHLTVYAGGSLTQAFQLGSLPFLPGAVLKVFAAASIAAAWRRSTARP